MNLSWRQLLLCGTAAGLLGYIGYSIITASSKKENSPTKPTSVNGGKKKRKAKSSRRNPETSRAVAGPSTASQGELPEELAGMQNMLIECDLSVPDLLKLSPEKRQKVFYALLMKGEMLMSRGPKELHKALEYFSKAVSLVPNPGEVVAAFEKTLPPTVFNALLDRIQRDIQIKVGEYFMTLVPVGGPVIFSETSKMEPGTERPIKLWVPMTIRNVTLGETLWTEKADVSSLSVTRKHKREYCEHCLKGLADEDQTKYKCPACDAQLYCSEQCCLDSAEIFHCYFCKPSVKVTDALEELYNLCQDTGNSLVMLVLRYVAFLLGEELKGNGAANNGPFAHYDHLRPVFRAPTEFDRLEAKLLRTVFSDTNKNIVDFLSDEIYTSMKATLARNVFAVLPDSEDESMTLSHLETRQINSTATALSFFHTAAHLVHSCDPNSMIICEEAQVARVVAIKNIYKDEAITTCFLPFREGTSTAERQLHLMRVFGFACECDLCQADLSSP